MSDAAVQLPLGHNEPPLAELLQEETRIFAARADALICQIDAAKIDSPEAAANVTTIGTMLADLKDRVELARKERARPFDEGKAAVQNAFARGLLDPINGAMEKARRLIDGWKAELRRQQAEEQQRRNEEARKAQEEAEAAEIRRKAAEQEGDTGAAIRAEMEKVQAADRAAALAEAPASVASEPIRSSVGMAAAHTQRVPVITDLTASVRFLREKHRDALIEAIMPVVSRLSRAKVAIPGVEIQEQQRTSFRR